jgi:hypothetical protein
VVARTGASRGCGQAGDQAGAHPCVLLTQSRRGTAAQARVYGIFRHSHREAVVICLPLRLLVSCVVLITRHQHACVTENLMRTVLSAKRAPNEHLVLRRAHVRTRVPGCSLMLALHRRSAPSGSAYSAVAAWGDGHPRPVGTCWPSFLGSEHGLTQPARGKSSCSKFSSSY